MWDAVRSVGTPFTLAAFCVAAIVTVALAFLWRRFQTIQSVTETERASVLSAGDVRTTELDMGNLTRDQKMELALKSMDQRIETIKHRKGLVIVLTVIGTITLVVLVALMAFAGSGGPAAEKTAPAEIRHVAMPPTAQPKDGELDEGPIPPPENFPSPEVAGIAALTDHDRNSPDFADTKVMIRNETGKRLQVLFSYRPYKKRDPQAAATDYYHRSTQYIMPGVTFEHREENFGGPVHVSINTDRKWIPTNEWLDLKVVPRRTLVVREDRGVFLCRVEYEEKSP